MALIIKRSVGNSVKTLCLSRLPRRNKTGQNSSLVCNEASRIQRGFHGSNKKIKNHSLDVSNLEEAKETGGSIISSGPFRKTYNMTTTDGQDDVWACNKSEPWENAEGPVMVRNNRVYSPPSENDLLDETIEESTDLIEDEVLEAPLEISDVPGSSDVAPAIGSGPWKKSKSKSLSQRMKEKEEQAKIIAERKLKLEKISREVSLNKSLVSYLDACVFNGQLNRSLKTLQYYVNRYKSYPDAVPCVSDITAYNIVATGFAKKGNYPKVLEIVKMITEPDSVVKMSVETYAAILECLGRLHDCDDVSNSIQEHLDDFLAKGYKLDDLFGPTIQFVGDGRELVLNAICRRYPQYTPTAQHPPFEYNCTLLHHLNEDIRMPPAHLDGVILKEKLYENARLQLETESLGTLRVKSIEKISSEENVEFYRKIAAETEAAWKISIDESFKRNMNVMLHQSTKKKGNRVINLYPFLNCLPVDDYVSIIIREIRKLAEGSEMFSPTVTFLHRELGAQVLSRYQVIYKKKHGIVNKIEDTYYDYCDWYLQPRQDCTTLNARQKWQKLLYKGDYQGPNIDLEEKQWPSGVLCNIGRFLYNIIMRDVKIDANIMRPNMKSEQVVPAFYSIFRMQGAHMKEEVKPHPALVKLFQAASRDELCFDANLVPMVSPPLPWSSVRNGGFLLTPAKIIRLPSQAHQQKVRLKDCDQRNLYPSLDSLNQLGSVPWTINCQVLDIVLKIFNNKGDEELGIPPPPSECPNVSPLKLDATRQEKYKAYKQRLALKRKRAEMYSLWCDALYRFSLANHFRDNIFWFPHNMDFRGRVYPCPPHLNHLGADVARSILKFAQGKRLGKEGLNWLKIHTINLTGLKKRESVEARLAYANEIIEDFIDSADHPLDGKKWWMSSEEPWQTLACCMEIAKAVRSPDPEEYVCHLPVHQDGSCNGLQHYAALGRDKAGAESVNLAPSSVPQDVYSSVAAIVEKLRSKDAENDVPIAQILEGFIKRKVIKQTVMTTVYGVTRYGARLQIAKQLKDLSDFPKEHVWAASLYLVSKTFESLQEMFTSTKEIQDWFTDCARAISQTRIQNVEWVTPLGLPIVQPYFKPRKRLDNNSHDLLRVSENHIFDMFERPNVMKQKNAFPPNFIHSLDSTHMMLTSLHCERNNITFVSVHDCYWTHPCSVEIMNKICREQFVALHSQPILEDLSSFLTVKYGYDEKALLQDPSMNALKLKLNELLRSVPKKGKFNIKQVLDSVYFFS